MLFLDELPEFPTKVLEVLRQPIESGEIWVSRANQKTIFPAAFQLLCAMNPCPCGYFGESKCLCTPDRIKRYQSKISGPLLDRIDMQIRLSRPDHRLMFSSQREETSDTVKVRVEQARNRQIDRQGHPNSTLPPEKLDTYIQQNPELKELAITTMEKFSLSARAIHRSLRVALSIADLNQENLNTTHFAEALSYRQNISK